MNGAVDIGEIAGGDDCRRFAECSTELALELLEGEERAWALAHAQGCERCAGELSEFTGTFAVLLEGAGRVAPAVSLRASPLAAAGATGQAGSSLGTGHADHAGRRRRSARVHRGGEARRRGFLRSAAGIRAMALAVPSFVAAASVGVVLALSGQTAPQVLRAAFVESGRSVGQVSLSGHAPLSVQIQLSGLRGAGTVRCAVKLRGGRTLVIGGFEVLSGRASWSGTVMQPRSRVVAVELVSHARQPVASAQIQ